MTRRLPAIFTYTEDFPVPANDDAPPHVTPEMQSAAETARLITEALVAPMIEGH